MSRTKSVSFIKPMLEQLEERAQPSFLFGSNAIQQLAQPLNNMVTDMTNAQNDLGAQFAKLQANSAAAGTNTFAGAEKVAEIMVSDWQRILSEAAAINATVNADVAFINTVAFSEFTNGDSLDLIILRFGPAIGFNPLTPLTNTVTQANNILNNPNSQSIVNLNLQTVNNHIDSTTPISQVTFNPTF